MRVLAAIVLVLVLASATTAAADTGATRVAVRGAPLISMIPTPASGSPPLEVAFALSTTAQGVTSWGVDFGDGRKRTGVGRPPATVHHTYKKAGTYLTQLSVTPGQLSLVYTVAQVTVGGGRPPALRLTARPTSGKPPLQVRFTLATSIQAQLVSWQLIFGDGWTASGHGPPPATIAHTYAKAGTYAAFLVVTQQHRYGGVRYTAPRGGLAIVIG